MQKILLVILVALFSVTSAEAGLFGKLFEKGCQAVGLMHDYFPYQPGFSYTLQTQITTQFPGEELQVSHHSMKYEHLTPEVFQGRKCKRTRTTLEGGKPHIGYFFEDHENSYNWSEQEKDWFYTAKVPQPKHGLKFTLTSYRMNGTRLLPEEDDLETVYEWISVGDFTHPKSGERFKDCFKQVATTRNGSHVIESTYAPGLGMVFMKGTTKQTVPDHGDIISVHESWMTDVSYR